MNPACAKCRTAKAALDEAGVEYTERRYLDDPPTAAELRDVLGRLGLEPWDVTRMNEAVAKELELKALSRDAEHRDEWVDHLVANPRLIQRPIITADDGTTVVARDSETLAKIVPSTAP